MLLLTLGVSLPAADGQTLDSLLTGKAKLKGLVVPLYVDKQPTPAALLRVERLGVEYQKRGFFRIGVLPMLVFDGVEIEVRQSAGLEPAWASVDQQLRAAGRGRLVELRRLRWCATGVAAPLLTADRARLNPGGGWDLFNAACRPIAAEPETFAEAALQASKGGHLRLQTRTEGRFLELAPATDPRLVKPPPSSSWEPGPNSARSGAVAPAKPQEGKNSLLDSLSD